MLRIAPARIRRIRDEMRLWLRSRHGIRPGYTKDVIDQGREDLGFGSVEDTLVAYTLFGGDLAPGMLDSLGLVASPGDIATISESSADSAIEVADLLGDE